MCQLLGISSNCEVDIQFSLRGWRHRGRRNPHGYGFAYWREGELTIVKAASSLFAEDQDEMQDVTGARSRVFLAHVRLASVGAQDGVNTHPFEASALGRSFAFAHNGTVAAVKARPLQRRPEGTTDSEHAFLLLLDALAETPGVHFAARLKELADEIRGLGRFNFLMSDGATLWAYADNSLHFIERQPPYGGELVEFVDDGYSLGLAEVKRADERAVLVCTQPLTRELGWRRMNPGELLIVRDGVVQARLGG